MSPRERAPGGMGVALAQALRRTYPPMVGERASPVDAEIAALCRRIGRIGGDRQDPPFRGASERR